MKRFFRTGLALATCSLTLAGSASAYDLSEANNKVTDLKLVEEVGYNGTLYSGYLDGYRKGSVMADPKEEK
ncbi:hypothetical protein [Mageeibacillus indolicus]|uniref:hypothetical protein n=1 Tax=Mageeibacillus indolicus TaxID=884684 RepID=UPI0004DD74A1|nr:hypothetical protein [Mageeibacillus indolicus]KFA57199.1 hypothetical protein HMPREF1632_04535 [Mageeibacillus indolicus 0009-5]